MGIRVNSSLPAVINQGSSYVKPLVVVLALAALTYVVIQGVKSLIGRAQTMGDPKKLHLEGLANLKNNSYDEAIQKFTLALKCNPERNLRAIILADRAAVYAAIEKPREAEADFALALQCNPNIAVLEKIRLKKESIYSPHEKGIALSAAKPHEPLQTRFNDATKYNETLDKNSQAIILTDRAPTQPHGTFQPSSNDTTDDNEALNMIFRRLGKAIPEINKLTTLSLNEKSIRTWMQANLEKLQVVTTLDLSNLNLAVLPPEIGLLTGLQELNLQNNQLTKLPLTIVKLTHLHALNLGGNQFTELPPEIGQLTHLQYLYLWRNQLTKLPSTIERLINLGWLDLRSNQLAELPLAICQLTNLRWLQLNNNQLTKLPPAIGELINLRWLFLEHNQLMVLPPEIEKLVNLYLYLDDNPVTMVPPTVDFMVFLQGLCSQQPTPSEAKELVNLLLHVEQSTEIDLNLEDKQITLLPSDIDHLTHHFQRLSSANQFIEQPTDIYV